MKNRFLLITGFVLSLLLTHQVQAAVKTITLDSNSETYDLVLNDKFVTVSKVCHGAFSDEDCTPIASVSGYTESKIRIVIRPSDPNIDLTDYKIKVYLDGDDAGILTPQDSSILFDVETKKKFITSKPVSFLLRKNFYEHEIVITPREMREVRKQLEVSNLKFSRGVLSFYTKTPLNSDAVNNSLTLSRKDLIFYSHYKTMILNSKNTYSEFIDGSFKHTVDLRENAPSLYGKKVKFMFHRKLNNNFSLKESLSNPIIIKSKFRI